MQFATAVLTDPSIPVSARQNALNRIFSDPGVPTSSTTSSFWLQDPRVFDRSPSPLPEEVDVVIVGSGITGASIARSLLENGASPSILMLEARNVCSGATGRNGGHILETADEYAEFADMFGVEEAKKLMRFRLGHLSEMLAVAKELGIAEESQARKVQFLSVYFGEEPWKYALERLRRFKADMPEEAAEWTSFEGQEIPKGFHLSRARGIVAGPAGALWPYKFVTGVLEHLLEKYPENFRIEEQTSVEEIETTSTFYKVKTSRGTVNARHVIHCTNAHVSHLVPGLRGRIFPVRGQMSAQTPGRSFPIQGNDHSWIFNYDRGFDYLTQLPGGQMMLGGGFAQGEHGGLEELGIPTDSEMSMYIDIHLSGALPAIFGRKDWGGVSGEPVQAMWTGNMAFSSDGFPWVGRLPESATGRPEVGRGGEWVCAAFGGEGMVQAWFSGRALASMLLAGDKVLGQGVDTDLEWFPRQLLSSKERFDTTGLPREIIDTSHRASL
ncbi:hypothetical protein N7452_004961 [Penicillium brevicompactum]|uniref:FAD dependent oxidoreductase domain-containing protein n=1 Tax=Penicillium brevicompactum TaxID=5074 RepID=A0A9W9QHQ4_PENBR|nr:hypothetical protein N7452_004961 [Penicillium brevicompactum]